MSNCAVYSIFFEDEPDKQYIGRSGNLENRWRMHIKLLNENKHHSYKLQEAFNTRKGKGLKFNVIQDGLTLNESICIEGKLIKKSAYNISKNSKGGRGIFPFSGIKTSDVLSNSIKFQELVKEFNNNNTSAIIKWIELRYGKPKGKIIDWSYLKLIE